MSKAKKIVLGVTGSIAAHKAADLASALTRAKCDVRVVMTTDAQQFITPLPFKTLTRNPVRFAGTTTTVPMLAEPTTIDPDGFVTLSEAPGLGIELDEDRLKTQAEEV